MPIDLSPIPLLDHHCHAFLRRAAPYTAAEYLGFFSEGGDARIVANHTANSIFVRWATKELAQFFECQPTLEAVLGQRLLRSICTHCRATYRPNDSMLAELGIARRDLGEKEFFYGKGCDSCNNTGYKGRKGIYELLRISDPIRELINERAPTVTIKQKAIELGMTTLRQDGLRSIFAGDTTIEEVLRYT